MKGLRKIAGLLAAVLLVAGTAVHAEPAYAADFGGDYNGVDVSSYQQTIDWNAVKNDGVDFVIIRAGYGDDAASQDDAYWVKNVTTCEQLGIPYGVYLYSHANYNAGKTYYEHLQSEVNHTLRLLSGHHPTLPVYLDMEENAIYRLGANVVSKMAESFCAQIENAGYHAGIYSSLNWWNSVLAPFAASTNYSKWIAEWNDKGCSYKGTYDAWQHSSVGQVDGISYVTKTGKPCTNTDMDIWYGSLQKYAGATQRRNVPQIPVLTGWNNLGGIWYYMDDTGHLKTGWNLLNGAWYYLTPGNGAMVTGWKAIDGKMYYMKSSGAMATGWQQIGGVWYYLNDSGALTTGWQYLGGNWYYMNPANGAMTTGWQQIDGKWYYMNENGAMQTGTQVIDGTTYVLDANGVWVG